MSARGPDRAIKHEQARVEQRADVGQWPADASAEVAQQALQADVASLGEVEFPVSWYLDDFPAVEYVPGVAEDIGSHTVMMQRWREIFRYAYDRVPGALYTVTVHPQTIGRAHHIAAFGEFLTELRSMEGIWWATMSSIFDACSPGGGPPTPQAVP